MELIRQVNGSRSFTTAQLLARVEHVEFAGRTDSTAIRRELKKMRSNIDMVLNFVKLNEDIDDEEMRICMGDIRRAALCLMQDSGTLLRSFGLAEREISEKIGDVSLRYKDFKAEVEGLCFNLEGGELKAVELEAAL